MSRNHGKSFLFDPGDVLFPGTYNTLERGAILREALSTGLQFVDEFDLNAAEDRFDYLTANNLEEAKRLNLRTSLDIFRTVVGDMAASSNAVLLSGMSIVINDRYWSLKTLYTKPNDAVLGALRAIGEEGGNACLLSLHPYPPAFDHLVRIRLSGLQKFRYFAETSLATEKEAMEFVQYVTRMCEEIPGKEPSIVYSRKSPLRTLIRDYTNSSFQEIIINEEQLHSISAEDFLALLNTS
ncbi:MAG: hypothetical protein QW812_00740 [Thermoplasmataceae archaeon]